MSDLTSEKLQELVALSAFTGDVESRVLLANVAAQCLALMAEIERLKDKCARYEERIDYLTEAVRRHHNLPALNPGKDELEDRHNRKIPGDTGGKR